MVMRVCDASGEAWLSVFNDQAEKIIGCSADELDRVKSEVKKHACMLQQVYTPLLFLELQDINVTCVCCGG